MWDFYRYVYHICAGCSDPELVKCFILQKIYVELDDSDGVAGSAAVNTLDPTLAERILQYEISGKLVVPL